MKLKLIIPLILMLFAFLAISCCIGNKKEAIKMLPRFLESDKLTLIIYEKGREIAQTDLKLNEEEKQIFEAWRGSFFEVNVDFNSYAPRILLLGEQIKVNFQDKLTIISYKKDPDEKAVWKQYSRKPTVQDKEIKDLFKRKLTNEPTDRQKQ